MRLELQVIILSSLLGIPLGFALAAYLRDRKRPEVAAPHARQT